MTTVREEEQAAAVRVLAAAARRRAEALAAFERETGAVREAVLAARHARVSVRRAAEIGEVATDTVNRWSKEARSGGLYIAEQKARALALPPSRGWALAELYRRSTSPHDRRVQLFDGTPAERGKVLRAAYKEVVADRGTAVALDEVADAAELDAVVAAAMAPAHATPVTAWAREVAAAVDPLPINKALSDVDRAAALLLQDPPRAWLAALRPRGSASLHIVGARQTLDAALISVTGGMEPGSLVRLSGTYADYAAHKWREDPQRPDPEGRVLAVVVAARWGVEGGPARYLVQPRGFGAAAEVEADEVTAADERQDDEHQDERGDEGR